MSLILAENKYILIERYICLSQFLYKQYIILVLLFWPKDSKCLKQNSMNNINFY